MSREYYFWSLVDRYISIGLLSYEEALKCARRDVYEVPGKREDLETLVKNYGFHEVEKVQPGTL
jgi:hypothetical protein